MFRLQYISQGVTVAEQQTNIERALDAGCRWIQLRFKNATVAERTYTAEKIKMLCHAYRATFIINDHALLAKEVDAHGVHLGLTDMRISEARQIIGSEKIIGGTANTLSDVMARHDEGCTYAGLGPFRFTATKEKLSPVLGYSGYQSIMEALASKKITIPVYAIGGILPEDVPALMNCGVYGVAVSGVIVNYQEKKEIVEQFNSMLYANA